MVGNLTKEKGATQYFLQVMMASSPKKCPDRHYSTLMLLIDFISPLDMLSV